MILTSPAVPQLPLNPFPSEDQDGPLDLVSHPEGLRLADSVPQPVTETEVFIDQVASHGRPLFLDLVKNFSDAPTLLLSKSCARETERENYPVTH